MDSPSISPHRVTELLAHWSEGDEAALGELTPLVYEDLRRLAHHYMSGQRPDHTLQTTALGERGLSAPGRPNQSKLAEPRPLFRRRRPSDAADSG